jgi:hypothetical protein
MPWTETVADGFTVRHDARDADDVRDVVATVSAARDRLEGRFPRGVEGDLAIVVHDSTLALSLAQPYLPLAWLATAPAARRYLAGWYARAEIHVLAPRVLRARASAVAGSLDLLLLTPAAMYVHLLVAASNPDLPPPFTVGSFIRRQRWAWLAEGAAQYFSGQTGHVRPAIGRRLREGGAPAFPPAPRDAMLLGGSIFDLLAEEEGERAAVSLATRPLPAGGADAALTRAFAGRTLRDTEGVWRGHLGRLAAAGAPSEPPARPGRRSRATQ